MPKVTAIIPTFNEEAHIEAAIQSVSWADEIIVVDSFSTDDTPDIAKSHPEVRFVQHEYINSAAQKNWIIPQALHPWIFILDADERVTDALENELMAFKAAPAPREAAYWIRRQNYFLGKKLRYVWKGDAVIRLFEKESCRYESLAVHAEIITTGKIGKLKGRLEHHTVLTMERYMAKMERYAQWSARDHLDRTDRVGLFHLYIKPGFRFFKHFILEGGVLDGKDGFTVSRLMAWGVRRRYEIIREMKKSQD